MADPVFSRALLDQILSGDAVWAIEGGDDNEWRRRLVYVGYVGGALAGAAIALRAAFGWRRQRTTRPGERAA